MAPFEYTQMSDAEPQTQPSSASATMDNRADAEEPAFWVVDHLTLNTSFSYGVTNIRALARTPYQHLLIGALGPYGRALFLDGLLQITEGDEALYHEPIVHTPYLVHGAPRSVLILGGADGAAAREALHWRSERSVVVVDLDAAVVDACRQHMPSVARGFWDDARVHLVVDDAVNYIDQCTQTFDAVVCDLTDPVSGGPSAHLFTPAFFGALHKRLNPGAAICVQSEPASLCDNAAALPRVCASLRTAFRTVAPMQVFVPTYASPLALTLATDREHALPSAQAFDDLLDTLVDGEMHVLDGQMFHGVFAVPRVLSKAVASETRPLQADKPAKEDVDAAEEKS